MCGGAASVCDGVPGVRAGSPQAARMAALPGREGMGKAPVCSSRKEWDGVCGWSEPGRTHPGPAGHPLRLSSGQASQEGMVQSKKRRHGPRPVPPAVRADLHGVLSLPEHQESHVEEATHRKARPERERSPTVPQRIANLCPVRHLLSPLKIEQKKTARAETLAVLC